MPHLQHSRERREEAVIAQARKRRPTREELGIDLTEKTSDSNRARCIEVDRERIRSLGDGRIVGHPGDVGIRASGMVRGTAVFSFCICNALFL